MNDENKNSLTESPVIVGTTPPSPKYLPALFLNTPSTPSIKSIIPSSPFLKNNNKNHNPSAKIGNYVYYYPPIGKGSSSKVYLGFSLLTNHKVAVKKINSVSIKKLTMERIKSEMELMKDLNHKNIVKYIDFFQDNNYVYVVTEYCNGGTLQEFMNSISIKFDELEIKFFMCQIRDAFQYLYSKNIYHRDVKPDNIFLCYNSQNNSDVILKVGDFGFAKEIYEEDMENTLCGTPLYVAPEVLIQNKYHLLSDLWSIGVILHQLFYKKFPFGKANNILELVKCMKNVCLEFPITKYKDKIQISLEGCDLLSSLLEIDPDKRITWDEFFNHAWFIFRDEKPQVSDSESDSEDEIENDKINEIFKEHNIPIINNDIQKKKKENILIIEDYCDKLTTSLPIAIPIPIHKQKPKENITLKSIYKFVTHSIENIKNYASTYTKNN